MRLTHKLTCRTTAQHAVFAPPQFVLLLITVFMLSAAPSTYAESAEESARTVLVTGSNRGIGLEFVRQYAAAGWEGRLFAASAPATSGVLEGVRHFSQGPLFL